MKQFFICAHRAQKADPPNSLKGYTLVELMMVMLLLTLFGIIVITLIQSGSIAYSKIADNRAAQSDARIAISYIDVRIRQNDTRGAVSLVQNPFGEGNALILRENFSGTLYTTWIFFYDGTLYECGLLLEGEQPSIEISQSIARLDGFTFEKLENGAIRQSAHYTYALEGEYVSGELSSLISLRAGGAVNE